MRTTTRLALAFFVATILALTFYAYPSWSGFITLAIRAAAILGVVAIAALVIAAMRREAPRRLDLILFLAAVGLIVASWSQVNARIDASNLQAEIAEAGEANILQVIAVSETETAALVRSANRLRDQTNAEISLLIESLWDDERLVITGGAGVDTEALARVRERIDQLQEAAEDAGDTIDAMLDAEIEAIADIVTPLPDSARLTFVDAAFQRVEVDRAHFHERLAIAVARLQDAESLVQLLMAQADAVTFDEEERMLAFEDEGAGAAYLALLGSIENSWAEDEALVAARYRTEIAEVLALVDAAGATP